MSLNWKSPPSPHGVTLQGNHVKLYPMTVDIADNFYEHAHHADLWTYLYAYPPKNVDDIKTWIQSRTAVEDTQMMAIDGMDENGVIGTASFMNINTAYGTIEVGNIIFTPHLQSTTAATECMYLMMQWAFANGYRRYEWKCNNNNLPSKNAAERFGFSYEGLLRNHTVCKDENRDTAWFSIIDSEWNDIDYAFKAWLSDDNFTETGEQKQSLRTLTAPTIKALYPR